MCACVNGRFSSPDGVSGSVARRSPHPAPRLAPRTHPFEYQPAFFAFFSRATAIVAAAAAVAGTRVCSRACLRLPAVAAAAVAAATIRRPGPSPPPPLWRACSVPVAIVSFLLLALLANVFSFVCCLASFPRGSPLGPPSPGRLILFWRAFLLLLARFCFSKRVHCAWSAWVFPYPLCPRARSSPRRTRAASNLACPLAPGQPRSSWSPRAAGR